MTGTDWLNQALDGHILVDTGFLTSDARKALDKAVRQGDLVKWRGHWHPVAGAPFGIGPLKTCYGTPDAKAQVAP